MYGGLRGVSGREPYNTARMDRLFSKSPGTHYPCAWVLPQITSTYTKIQIDDAVKAIFHFDDGFEWRWPERHERIYHRLEEGVYRDFPRTSTGY